MTVKVMTGNASRIDAAINASCEMMYDIEELMARGPQQMESYTTLLSILKDMKRGIPSRRSINVRGIQCCPPNAYSNETCMTHTCQECWEAYVENYIDKRKEKNTT